MLELIDFCFLLGVMFDLVQMTTYTVCKVMFKGDPTGFPSSSSAGEIEDDLSLIPQLNSNSSGGLSKETEVQNPNQITSSVSLLPHVNNNNSGGLSTDTEVVGHFTTIFLFKSTLTLLLCSSLSHESSFELQDLRLFSSFLYLEEDAHIEDATLRALNYDGAKEDEELVNLWSMQEDRNDHRPKMSLTGFISDDDDSDSDSISASTTVSIIFTVTICGNPLFSGSTSQKAKSLVSYDMAVFH